MKWLILSLIFSGCFFQNDHSSSSQSPSQMANEQSLDHLISKTLLFDSENDVDHITNDTSNDDLSSLGWYLTFEDHFDDAPIAMAKGAAPECFTKTPYCMINWWTAAPCPEFSSELLNLNKCNWAAYNYYNYMDLDSELGQGINAFHPTMIEVKNGYLYLNAAKSFYTEIDCKNKFKDPRIGNIENFTFNCPIISGGIESRPNAGGNFPGFMQEFGRFEVKAKLNNGPGAWPAHWLGPKYNIDSDGCGWPYTGEIDIMESWVTSDEIVSGTLHTGDCDRGVKLSKGFPWKAKSGNYPELTSEQRKKTFYTDFHTYAVEWDEQKIRFLVDDNYIGQISSGDKIRNKNTPLTGLPVEIPKGPFYWMLNTTIYRSDETQPDPDNFEKQEHIIDYVKVYRKCKSSDAPEKCYKPNYKNTDALCPGLRDYLGDHNAKPICKAWPHFAISVASCNSNQGLIDPTNQWCLFNEGTRFKARSIGEACAWPREHLGWFNSKPVCKAFPHFRINSSNCDGSTWQGYCLLDEQGWWKAREIKN